MSLLFVVQYKSILNLWSSGPVVILKKTISIPLKIPKKRENINFEFII